MPDYITLENIFLVLAVFSTIFYIIKMCLFLFLGGDVEVHTDFETLTDCDPSFNFFSIQSILAFFMGFGWVGLTFLTQMETSSWIAFTAAFVVGVIFMFISAWLMFMIKRLDKNVKIDMNDYVGTVGRAYTSFKPNSSGQIEITINDQLSVLNAVNCSDEEINAFMPVKIEKYENNTIYIIKV